MWNTKDAERVSLAYTPDSKWRNRGEFVRGRQEIATFFGVKQVEIIAPPEERRHVRSYRSDVESAILETISRRPCTVADLEKMLGLHSHEINKYLGVLEESGKVETLEEERGIFYQLSASR